MPVNSSCKKFKQILKSHLLSVLALIKYCWQGRPVPRHLLHQAERRGQGLGPAGGGQGLRHGQRRHHRRHRARQDQQLRLLPV